VKKRAPGLLDKTAAFIYFIAFEVLVYYGLSFLLFDPVPKNTDNQEAIIVQNWNGFIYFFLLYAAIVISTMLVLVSALSRRHKPQVMFFFWLSWLGLGVMLLAAFN
jgi:uncharacterized integral membrane protein